jgi:hypothetical protein
MTETLLVAAISVFGVLLGSLITGWYQLKHTSTLADAELERYRLEKDTENKSRLLHRKQDLLLENLAELLIQTDPEIHKQFNYPKIISLIHKMQLILDLENKKEGALNDAINKMGLSIQNTNHELLSHDKKLSLLKAQDAIVTAGRAVIYQLP